MKILKRNTQSNLNNTLFNKPIIKIKTPDQPPIFHKNKMNKNKYLMIKPDNFSGQGDINHFFKQYEKVGLINN